jgi:hypothetical protein
LKEAAWKRKMTEDLTREINEVKQLFGVVKEQKPEDNKSSAIQVQFAFAQ